jgi:hypothetical protein
MSACGFTIFTATTLTASQLTMPVHIKPFLKGMSRDAAGFKGVLQEYDTISKGHGTWRNSKELVKEYCAILKGFIEEYGAILKN